MFHTFTDNTEEVLMVLYNFVMVDDFTISYPPHKNDHLCT